MNGFKPPEIKTRNGKKVNSKIVNSRKIGILNIKFKLENKDKKISSDTSSSENSRQDIAKHFFVLEQLGEITEGAESNDSSAYR